MDSYFKISNAGFHLQCILLQRPAHGFQPNMKLEAVDKRNPMLIRVATIMDKDDYRVKVCTPFKQAIPLLKFSSLNLESMHF